jgi:hypothetical protein
MTILQMIMLGYSKPDIFNKTLELKISGAMSGDTANRIYNYCIWHWGL